jgi:hypothetical protein
LRAKFDQDGVIAKDDKDITRCPQIERAADEPDGLWSLVYGMRSNGYRQVVEYGGVNPGHEVV